MKIGAVAVAGVALVLCACGNKEPDPAGAAATSAQPSGQARTDEGAVAGVLESPGTAVASLWFELAEKPVAGQPFALKLLVSAAQPIAQLRLAVDAPELTVEPQAAVLDLSAAGTRAGQDLQVTAAAEGLVDLRVRLAAEGAAETVYAIPVLVAAP